MISRKLLEQQATRLLRKAHCAWDGRYFGSVPAGQRALERRHIFVPTGTKR